MSVCVSVSLCLCLGAGRVTQSAPSKNLAQMLQDPEQRVCVLGARVLVCSCAVRRRSWSRGFVFVVLCACAHFVYVGGLSCAAC